MMPPAMLATSGGSTAYVEASSMSNSIPSKACSKCGVAKPYSAFGKEPRNPTGVDAECKKCMARRRFLADYSSKFRDEHNDAWYEAKLSAPACTKICATCKKEKHVSCFYRARRFKSGFVYQCKECSRSVKSKLIKRNSELRSKYGISVHTYNSMLKEQDGKCAICKRICESGRRLAVDHSHNEGRVRGLLCSKCNRAIGLFRDDPAIMSNALDYLMGL